MMLYVDLPPGDPRVLPDDPRIRPRPDVVALAEADRLEHVLARRPGAWVEVGSPRQLRRAANAGACLWLVGEEAGGVVGQASTLVLIRAAVASGRPWVATGLGRRGMAAALAIGAAGVQVDVHTWLLGDSPLAPSHQERLERAGARDTVVEDARRRLGDTVLPNWVHDERSGLPASAAIGDVARGPALAAFLPSFADELSARVERARLHHPLRSDPFGTGRPLVQGPMANVSETPGFAHVVRRAGGLPFCALGALRPAVAEDVLEGMTEVTEPWGAGVIGFDVMPFRDAHLAAVQNTGPRPVILAGGSPGLARKLVEAGLEPWLHTPSARLARLALRRGCPAVVFEGREAGGHVGRVGSVALWEEGLAVAEEAGPALVVLAAGIGDAASAAFAGAMAADAHHLGHRIALQVGTALFFTHELVEQGQITPTYQQRALSAESTHLVGDTVDLPLRCTPNPYTRQTRADEVRWREEGLSLRERRERVEHRNLGRTRIAAKGIERNGDGGYRAVPLRRQLDEAAFTVGDGATVTQGLTTVDDLFRSLTDDAAALLESSPRSRPEVDLVRPPEVRQRSIHRTQHDASPIAIVGMGCVLPGAPDVPSFWDLLRYGRSAIRPVPDERWRNDRYFHPDPDHAATVANVRMAGVVTDLRFDSASFAIPPSVVPSMDRAQQLALVAAAEAIRGLKLRDRRRTAVLLGNSMGGEHAKSLAVRVRFREVLAALGRDGDLALERYVDQALGTTLPPVDVESMSGLLSNVIAGRIASWLDLGGGNATVDAACAASLAALTMAVDNLRAGRTDLVLTGGVDADLSPETFVGFCRTHALSRTGSHPFSTHADGFVMGEGAVVLALQRQEDAIAQGHPVYAILRGIGQASDGRSTGITAPKADGQELAIRRALSRGEVDPRTVEMLEAHGTGTALGDRTEVDALSRVYDRGCIGSVKSQIGHLKGAAGAAGLLKAVLAVHHGVIPPTLGAGPLRPELRDGPFQVPRGPQPFQNDVRRAAVSAFGFGGTDFHVVLEADRTITSAPAGPLWQDEAAPRVRFFGAASPADLARDVRAGHDRAPEEATSLPHRAAVLDRAPGLAAWILDGGRGAFGRSAWVAEGAPRPVVAVFPGQGSRREGAADVLCQIQDAHEVLLALGETSPDTSADPAAQHHLLVATGAAYGALLDGVPLAGVLGHSVGELSALCAGGWFTPEEALRLADARGEALHGCPPGAMLAVTDGPDLDLHLAARNSPGNRVWAGPREAVEHTAARLDTQGVRSTLLDVERAFHTPDVSPAGEALRSALATAVLEDGAPWYANVDGVPTQPGRDDLIDALARAVTTTVGFEDALLRAREDGHTLFVQAGPGRALTRHIERTLPEATVLALHPDHDPLGRDLVFAAAALAAEGHTSMLRRLPGTWLELPFPVAPLVRPTPTGSLAYDDLPDLVEEPRPVEPLEASEPLEVDDGLRGVVLQSIAEITGYPRAALASGARLDTDLGIDSIRKMEILGRIQEQVDIEVDESALAAAEGLDIDGLVALLEAGHPTLDGAPAREPAVFTRRRWSVAPTGRAETPPLVLDDAPLAVHLQRWIGRPLAEDTAVIGRVDDPAHHGVAAFLRVAAAEAGVRHRVVLTDGSPADDWTAGTGTVLLHDGEGSVDGAGPATPTVPLPDAPVVLASGGTSGILSPCLEALPGARGVVFGRRAEGTPPDGFLYVQADLLDLESVRAAAELCRRHFGRIDVVVHAAGLLRDGPVERATPEDVQAVVDVKITGARHLFAATHHDRPALYIPFSSVSASLANPGQALYAAANAMLEHLEHPTATRTAPLAWTAWTDRGMARDDALQKLLAARGIRAVSPTEGAGLFLQALQTTGRSWIADRPPPHALPWPLTAVRATHHELTVAPGTPIVDDHVVAGTPLVAGAVWMAALLAVDPDTALADIRILAPTIARREVVARVQADGLHIGDRQIVRSRRRPKHDVPPPDGRLDGPAEPAPYDSLLFHGPAWQVLSEVRLTDEAASARYDAGDLDPCAALIDGVHQLLAVWAHRLSGRLALPVGADHWQVHRPTPTGALHLTCSRAGEAFVADVLAVAPDGRILAHALGVRLEVADA